MNVTVGIGLLGCGTVGAAVAQRLLHDRDAIERGSGVRYTVRAIAVEHTGKPRPCDIDASLFTGDARAVIDDPSVDLIVECIGATVETAELIERALERGRHVVTANKDLIANQGPRLFALARVRGVTLACEAAACGAVPVVRTICDALAGDEIHAIAGVLNGTCTSILSSMEQGNSYAHALADAQLRGFAESNPASDVEGADAAHKLALLVQLGFGLAVVSPRIRRSGITRITQSDIARATILGYRLRLVAAASRSPHGAFAEVAPVLVARDHPFARTTGAENAVLVRARDAGCILLGGLGAGGAASASAVIGDVISALRAIASRSAVNAARVRLEPAIDVSPFFHTFTRHADFPRYPQWDDTCLEAPASQASLAFAWPGKD